ncbi:NUDIX domain-containing protein [Bradyrhizobium sp. HKCCYLS20291]|uniref:NUDIX hydrolase n=1 Tax=Bradyrhizobium sp. HKCCYLS20291 TaxID=3420766 RepID=UPI003EB82394
MARAPIVAAGGIVLRREQPPRIAVVRLRKRDEWVLPKGKLDDGETPRDAAKREVLEETGHKVTVHEFLGTLVHDTGTRSKVVHYWRMEAAGEASQPLMDDVRAVDWLPLDAAVERLSRDHEKTFLETVGPYALAGLIRKTRAKPALEPASKAPAENAAVEKPAPARRRRSRVTEQPTPSQLPDASVPVLEPAAAIVESTPEPVLEQAPMPAAPDMTPLPVPSDPVVTQPDAPERVPADLARIEAVAAAIKSLVPPPAAPAAESGRQSEDPSPAMPPADAGGASREHADAAATDAPDGRPRTLAQKMRAWLGRAA